MIQPGAGPTSSTIALGRVRAIGLDTNAFGSKHLSLERLSDLVRRAKKHGSLEVWIPESVLWEWAEHAAAEHKTAVVALERLRRAGLTTLTLASNTVDKVLEDLRASLDKVGPPLKVLPVDDVARAALRDQIMLQGPAKTRHAKDGSLVKTGAADSAHLRAFCAEGDDDSGLYVVVSQDNDATRAFKSWDIAAPRIFSSVHDAIRTVFEMVPTDDAVQAKCLAFLATQIDDVSLGSLKGDVEEDLYDGQYEGEFANVGAYADIPRHPVGLNAVEVDRTNGFVTGTMFALANVTAEGVTQDTWGDSTVQEWAEIVAAQVTVTCTFDLEDGEPQSVTIDTDEGTTRRPTTEFLSPDDAFNEVLDAMTTLPGLSDLEWLEARDGERRLELKVLGAELTVELSGRPSEDWEIQATYGGRDVTLACRFLNDGYTDREGGFPSHFGLSCDVAGPFGNNPVWAINLLVLANDQWESLQERPDH